KLMPIFILGTVLVTIVQGMEEMSSLPALETIIEGIFVFKLLLRFCCCPNQKAFFLSLFNLIDLLSVLPLVYRACLGFQAPSTSQDAAFLFGFVPVVRLLKILRFSQYFHLIVIAFSMALEALPVLLFIYIWMWLAFAAVIFACESRDNVSTLESAMWLTFISMTTVGYGDRVPQSTAGRLTICVLVITSMLYVSIPLAIIGDGFREVWSHRDCIMLLKRTKEKLFKWGYKAGDIPVIFGLFDLNGNGELDYKGFETTLTEMGFGFTKQRTVQLFDLFDVNKSGTVDSAEFVRTFYPEEYHSVFNAKSKSVLIQNSSSSTGRSSLRASTKPALILSPQIRQSITCRSFD
ncbi:unnamed protein product, partial [Polarella glacialis]